MQRFQNQDVNGGPDAIIEILVYVAIIFLAGVAVLISALQPWIDPRWLYMDPQTVGEIRETCCHVYDGAISSLGIMFWAATAAIGLFAAILKASLKQDYMLEALTFALSSVLMTDDAFLLHEVVMPKFGVPQSLVIVVLGLLTLAYLFVGRHQLLRSQHVWLLGLSLALFATSVLVDQIFSSIESMMIVYEDGPKFVGILCWLLFHISLFREDLLRMSSKLHGANSTAAH